MKSAETFTEAFSILIDIAKESRPVTLGYICKRSNIPSRGYLSLVLSGRRKLSQKHFSAVAATFSLDEFERSYLEKLLQIDHEQSADKLKILKQELEVLRKALTISFDSLENSFQNLFFAFKVFSAFGLYDNSPTLVQLVNFFGIESKDKVVDALAWLTKSKLVNRTRTRYQLAENIALFTGSDDAVSHFEFLKMSLLDSIENLEFWFQYPKMARFHSTILSVKQSAYQDHIENLRKQIIEDQTKLEDQDGDMLIHYNVQVYPTRSKRGEHRV